MSQFSHDLVPLAGEEGDERRALLLADEEQQQQHQHQQRKKQQAIDESHHQWLNALFAVGMVVSQVAENASLPLFVDSLHAPDPYFVLSFASYAYVVIFGVWLFVFEPRSSTDYPHAPLVHIGVANGTNGLLLVFASPSSRTAPYLQAILGNGLIPMTIALRYFMLRKGITLVQTLSAALVLGGLVLSLSPTIFGFDGGQQGRQTGSLWWPFCFMASFFPSAFLNVRTEKTLKQREKPVGLIWFLFWTSLYQAIWVTFCVWAAIIPGFGVSSSFDQLARDWGNNVVKATLSTTVPNGIVFIATYITSAWFTAKLLRWAEGATWVAVVQTLVTPLGLAWWMIFANDGKGSLSWSPHWSRAEWCVWGGLVVMAPGIFYYRYNK